MDGMIDCAPSGREKETLPCILVVEDEVLIRMDISDELRRGGYTVLEAKSAEDAQALLAASPEIDVVFSDFELFGELDGWDLHRIVSANYPGMGFILTSARTLRQECEDNGVFFVPKPYSQEAVLNLIGRVIDSKENRRRDE
jgi:two-component system, response regulator PdtaR